MITVLRQSNSRVRRVRQVGQVINPRQQPAAGSTAPLLRAVNARSRHFSAFLHCPELRNTPKVPTASSRENIRENEPVLLGLTTAFIGSRFWSKFKTVSLRQRFRDISRLRPDFKQVYRKAQAPTIISIADFSFLKINVSPLLLIHCKKSIFNSDATKVKSLIWKKIQTNHARNFRYRF